MINPIEISKSTEAGRVGFPVPERSFPVSSTSNPGQVPAASTDTEADDGLQLQNQFGRINSSKDALNRAALEVRNLGEAKNLMDRLGSELQLIVKSFPPFPPGSMEREAFLNSVAGIRAMIERLTFPPAQAQSLRETLSAEAFVNPAASNDELAQGLNKLNEQAVELAQTQQHLVEDLPLKPEVFGDEAYFVDQSRGVGKALLESGLSIGRDARNLMEILA